MFTRHLGNGIGHQCQHTTHVNDINWQGENEDDINHDEDLLDEGGNWADEDEDADDSDSDELADIEEGNTEDDGFSDEDDTGYDDL